MRVSNTNKTNCRARRKVITLSGTTGVLGLLGLYRRTSEFFATGEQPMDSDSNLEILNNNINKMKTIGILGGVGPQATMNLEEHIHLASHQLIPRLFNSGYPPMIVYYHRYAPVQVNKDLSPVFPLRPDNRLLDAAKKLGAISDFLVIPSNGIHAMQHEIENAAGRKVLSIIDVTLAEVKKRQWKKVGVAGYKNANVYTNRLKELGIGFETVNVGFQEKLDISIMKVMEGRESIDDRALALEVISNLRSKNVDGIIPGCTELPLLLGQNMNAPDLINPAKLLAEAAVRFSIS